MNKAEAYRIVFEDLKTYPLFCGQYDAKNENDMYMYGILAVMESISMRVSNNAHGEFLDTFFNNMVAAENQP